MFITKLVVHNHCYRDNNRTYQHLDKKFPFFRMTFSERSWSALQLSPCSGITSGFDASFSIYIVLKKFTVSEKIPTQQDKTVLNWIMKSYPIQTKSRKYQSNKFVSKSSLDWLLLSQNCHVSKQQMKEEKTVWQKKCLRQSLLWIV